LVPSRKLGTNDLAYGRRSRNGAETKLETVAVEKVCEVEDEILSLPSDFSEEEGQKYGYRGDETT
jgi:hypothetical protein